MSIEKLDLQSRDLVNDNIDKIAALFPNCLTESASGKVIDFDLLRQELSHDIVEGNKERYRLEWPGRKEAMVTTNLPTSKTLRPVRSDSMDFDSTENIYIEGDNLEVLKILQESYLSKIKMIYIDPPYNTGNDFIYKDNFNVNNETELFDSGQKDEYNQRLVANPETAGRYHSDWLSMMYPRLMLSRNLLKSDGVIFISIGAHEISNLTILCDTVFGAVNRIGIIGRLAKAGGNKGRFFSPNIEYLLVYGRDKEKVKGFSDDMDPELIKKVYTKIQKEGSRAGEKYRAMGLYQSSLDARKNQRYFIEAPDGSFVIPPGSELPELKKEGEKVIPKNIEDGCWRWTYDTYLKEKEKGNVEFSKTKNKVLIDENGNSSEWNVNTKIWLRDRQESGQLPNDLLTKYENRHSAKELKDLGIPFDFAKPTELIQYLIRIVGIENEDIVLDFFSGSGTTAQALLQHCSQNPTVKNTKYIMIQLPELIEEKSEAFRAGFENICELGKERIRRAAKKIKEETGADIDYGFRVFRLDESNMQDVYYKPQDYQQANLDLFADNVKPDRTADDLLAQVMLDWGLPLSLKIEQASISGKLVFKVADNSLFACFDKGIDEEFAKEIAKDAPLRVVFRDSSFKNDTAKVNVKQLLKQLSPETEMKVI